MNEDLLNILSYVILAILLLNPLVFIYWFFSPDSRKRFMRSHELLTFFVYLCSFAWLMAMFSIVIEKLLFWIPMNLGRYNVDGEFEPLGHTIAFILSFILSLFFAYVFYKIENIREENRNLHAELELKKRKEELKHLTIESLKKKRNEIETKINRLNKKEEKCPLSSDDNSELQILLQLLDEIDKVID